MKFSDIPRLISAGSWECHYSLGSISAELAEWQANDGLQLNPDFQRGHVWTPQQQTSFMEYILRGGQSGMVIYFNKPSWVLPATTPYDEFVCVDGLQRLTAIQRFLANEIRAFGQLYSEFGEDIRRAPGAMGIRFNVNTLQTREQVLNWYLQINDGGTPHTAEEIERVRGLLLEAKGEVK